MSGYIGPAPVPQATQTRQTFVATSGQTSFATVGYVAGGQFIQVYLNGVLLKLTDDYTAANGSDIILTSGAATGDVLEFISFADFTVNNQNFTGGLTVDNDGSTVLTVDRATSDGTIIDLQKSGSSVGIIASRAGVVSTIVLNPAGTDGAGLTGGTDTVAPTNGLGAVTNGELDLGFDNGKFRDLYLSGGVVFGDAGGSGTSSSNSLDSYEEGTWAPTYRGSSTAGTATVGSTEGFYTKIGNSVTIWLRIANMTISGAAGATLITGLPFTSTHGSSAYASVAVGMTHNIDFDTSRNQSFYVVGTSLNGLESRNGTVWVDWAVTNSAGIYMNFTMTYRTA